MKIQQAIFRSQIHKPFQSELTESSSSLARRQNNNIGKYRLLTEAEFLEIERSTRDFSDCASPIFEQFFDIANANLQRCYLANMKFKDRSFRNSDLTGSDISGSNFLKADLTGATLKDLVGAVSLAEGQLYIPPPFQNEKVKDVKNYQRNVETRVTMHGIFVDPLSEKYTVHPFYTNLLIRKNGAIEEIAYDQMHKYVDFEQVIPLLKNMMLHTIDHFVQEDGGEKDMILIQTALSSYGLGSANPPRAVLEFSEKLNRIFFGKLKQAIMAKEETSEPLKLSKILNDLSFYRKLLVTDSPFLEKSISEMKSALTLYLSEENIELCCDSTQDIVKYLSEKDNSGFSREDEKAIADYIRYIEEQ